MYYDRRCSRSSSSHRSSPDNPFLLLDSPSARELPEVDASPVGTAALFSLASPTEEEPSSASSPSSIGCRGIRSPSFLLRREEVEARPPPLELSDWYMTRGMSETAAEECTAASSATVNPPPPPPPAAAPEGPEAIQHLNFQRWGLKELGWTAWRSIHRLP